MGIFPPGLEVVITMVAGLMVTIVVADFLCNSDIQGSP
jgi:hypothetical protein